MAFSKDPRCRENSLKSRTAGLQGEELRGGAAFIVQIGTLWSSSVPKFFFWAQEAGRTTDTQSRAGLSPSIAFQRVTR